MRVPLLLARAAQRPLLLASLVFALGDVVWTVVLFPRFERARWRTVDGVSEGMPALVLACQFDQRVEPNGMLASRLRTALSLYQAGKARWLLLSGFDQEPVVMSRWLLKQGVPRSALVLDQGSRRTYDSVQRAANVYGLRRLLVVTSDFHLPRALWLADHVGIDAEGVPASSEGFAPRRQVGLFVREYAARNRAVLDVWLQPQPRGGPHEPPPP
jgi:vancomycin permeability regulator SanA